MSMTRLRNESGATAVVVASMMLFLLGMAALVIDVGFGFNERRQDQTSADVAVMAGALEFGGTDAQIVAAVKSYARKNLDTTYTNAEWDALWASCTDSGRNDFGSFTPLSDGTTTYDCISTEQGAFLRVRIPDQLINTTFAKVLGVNQLTTNAFAIAQIAPDGGGVRPFGLIAGAGPGLTCLRTGPPGVAQPPCPGPTDPSYTAAGNFYIIDSPFFGNNEATGTPTICGNGQPQTRYSSNLAIGLDHFVTVRGGNPALTDTCGNDRPNTLFVQPGNGLALDPGLFKLGVGAFTNGKSSLLQQGPFSKRLVRSQANNYNLDNVPLWAFISAGPAGCTYATISGLPSEAAKQTAMDSCLASPLLKLEGSFAGQTIDKSPRLAWVPKFVENSWPMGAGSRTIASFEPVFLHGLYFNCDNNGCDQIFIPGEATTPVCEPAGPNCKALNSFQLTSFVLTKAMLDPLIVLEGPGGTLGLNFAKLWR